MSSLDKTRETFAAKVHALGGSAAAGRALKISRSYVEMLRKGTRAPGLAIAARIEDVTGIPMRGWIAGAGSDGGSGR